MRKLALLTTALVAVLAMAAVAIAQTTGYNVNGSTKPSKAGSKKKPVPLALQFGLEADSGTNRPTTARRFRLEVEGIRTNGQAFPRCTLRQINEVGQGSDDGCSRKALVGTGTVNNLAGNVNDPTDRSITCNLDVKLYNGGKNKVSLYLEGGPSGFKEECAVPISQALDARWVKAGKNAIALQFDIPENLQNPVPGVANAIKKISATLPKRTVKKKGKRIGYIEAIGCRGGRDLVLTTWSAGGGTLKGRTSANC